MKRIEIERKVDRMCSECRWWTEGRCERYPPVMMFNGIRASWVRPVVEGGERCGEYKSKGET